MNTSQGALHFGASIDLTEWRRNVDQMRRDILGLTQTVSTESRNIDSSFKNLAVGVASYFSIGAIRSFTTELINVRGEFQKTEIAFTTMLGNADKAKDLMAEMVNLAAKTPFSLMDVSAGAKQLLAFQVPADQVVDTLTRMGNIAAGLSVPLSRINLVYGQVRAKGKLMGDDLRQFTEAGIPLVAELAKKFNKTTAEITEMVSAGKIGFKDVQDVLFAMTNEGGMFFNLMEKQSKSLSGQVANLGDAWDKMLNKIGESNEGLISEGIQGLTYLVDHYQEVTDILLVLITTYGAYRAALIATVAIQKASVLAGNIQAFIQLASSIRSAKDAQILFNTVTKANPYVLAATALAALSAGLYVYFNRVTEAEKAQQELNAEISRQQAPISATKTKIESLVSAIKQENATNAQRSEWLRQIQSLSNGRLNQLTIEQIRTNNAATAINGYIKQLYKEAEAKAYLAKITEKTEKRDELRAKLKTKLSAGDLLDDLTDIKTATNDKNGKGLSTLDRRNLRIVNGINALSGEIQDAKNKVSQLTKEGVIVADVIPDASVGKLEEKTTNVKRDLAEVFSKDSIADLEQRISLWKEALSKASGNTVQELTKNKFGDTVKTGNTVTLEKAKKEVEVLEEDLAKRQKEIQTQSFQERIDEAERQWDNYYKMAEFYGKETADAQYSDLFKGSQNYLEYLEKQEQALKDLSEKGVLSDQQKKDLIFLRDKISSLTGAETPLENFKRDVDETLKTLPSLVDQLDYLNKISNNEFQKGNKSYGYLQKNPFLTEKKNEILQQQQNTYQEFLNEQRSFETKKIEIEQKYNDIRKKIGENDPYSEAERLKLLTATYRNEQKEITDLNLEGIRKTDLWVKAFGDLQIQGIKSLKNLKKGLQDLISSGKVSEPTEIKSIQDQILKIEETLSSRNPFEAIGLAIDKYKKKRQELNEIERKSGRNSDEYKAKLEDVNQSFVGIIEVTGQAATALIDTVGTIGDAFGGLSDDLKQTLTEVQQLVDGIVNTVAGYFSGNYGQMISGIVQIVGAMVKLLSGDKGRERQIKEWQTAVDGLKTSYNELQYAIEKTAGEASLAMNRGLIENLEEQKRLLTQMRDEESKKKKSDAGKIASLNDQISQVNQQINDVIDNFKKQIVGTEFKELSQRLADALIEAFGQGENAAEAFDKVVEDVMRNAVANALKMKFLDEAAQSIVNSIYSSMGFGNGANNLNDGKIKEAEDKIKELEKQIKQKESQTYTPYLAQEVLDLKKKRQELLDLIGKLKAEMASVPAGGSFDGLSQEERDKIKEQGQAAMNQYIAALQQYEDLFGAAAENAQGLKGDIKGITEKTAGALEAQFNALRINFVAMLQYAKQNHTVQNAHTVLLSQIEINTRRLHNMDKTLTEMNAKMKKSLAGVP